MADLTGCTIRKASPDDASDILQLINLVQPHIPWSLEYFRWQFYGDLGEDSTMLYLVFADGNVVALYSAVKKRCYVGGEIKEGFMVQDVMTHPDFRGRGFLNELAGRCVQDIVAGEYSAYTFPNKLSENSFRRSEWTELGAVPARSMKVSAGMIEEDVGFVESIDHFDQRALEIWEGSGLKLGVYRDADYLNWRYGRPETQYLKFYIDRNKGFMVLKLFPREEGDVIHLLDLVVVKSARNLVEPALRSVGAMAARKQAELLTAWLFPGHPYAACFDAFGLQLEPDIDRFVFVRAPGHELDFFSQNEAWHLSQGDSDVY